MKKEIKEGWVGVCGCGKPSMYINVETGKGSCNKYMRCRTYEELEVYPAMCLTYESILRRILNSDQSEGFEHKAWAKEVLTHFGVDLSPVPELNEIYEKGN